MKTTTLQTTIDLNDLVEELERLSSKDADPIIQTVAYNWPDKVLEIMKEDFQTSDLLDLITTLIGEPVHYLTSNQQDNLLNKLREVIREVNSL